ncbi:MAG TPA: hypothetical protein VH877_28770 [Polyangia bacterium]|jgi:hypothetical protein|nr:hypothetical protein [Polyangia bacterium]
MRHERNLLLLSLLLGLGACGKPAAPTCTDAARNGNETDVDCGGGTCGACAANAACRANTDCQTGICGPTGRCSRYQGGAIPPQTTAIYRITPGANTNIQPGVKAGYGITANTGGAYRLVWTGQAPAPNAPYRVFRGSVWTLGTFSNVTPGCSGGACPVEEDDYVSTPATVTGGQRIDFDATTDQGVDGFDFVTSAEPVYFDLYVDGARVATTLVAFPATDNGGAVSPPGEIPFGLTMQ